jgi:hypothetical protein
MVKSRRGQWIIAGLALVVVALTVVVAGAGSKPARRASAAAATAPTATGSAVSAAGSSTRSSNVDALNRKADRLFAIARKHYADEVGGRTVHQKLAAAARAPAVLSALRAGNMAALQAAVYYQQAGTHQHISHMRVIRGSQVLADSGVVFCVAGASQQLKDAHGRPLATMQATIQDEIGFVRLMHRTQPVDVVIRGRGPAHVRTSLNQALGVKLPDNGLVKIAGRRYAVRSFNQMAWAGEPVKVWILVR